MEEMTELMLVGGGWPGGEGSEGVAESLSRKGSADKEWGGGSRVWKEGNADADVAG